MTTPYETEGLNRLRQQLQASDLGVVTNRSEHIESLSSAIRALESQQKILLSMADHEANPPFIISPGQVNWVDEPVTMHRYLPPYDVPPAGLFSKVLLTCAFAIVCGMTVASFSSSWC